MPGQTQVCRCPAGATGIQPCAADGTGWDACACEDERELVLEAIDGDGTEAAVADPGGATAGLTGRQDAARRFAAGWWLTGTNLDLARWARLQPPAGTEGSTFDETSGLRFAAGGDPMRRRLELPAGLIAGSYVLLLLGAAGEALAEERVFVLQGEKGDTGEAGTDGQDGTPGKDGVGNVWEWVAWWAQAGPNMAAASWSEGKMQRNWGTAADGYGDDVTWNLDGRATGWNGWKDGLPAAGLRGGHWYNGTNAGAFTVTLSNAPSSWSESLGFRCCRTAP